MWDQCVGEGACLCEVCVKKMRHKQRLSLCRCRAPSNLCHLCWFITEDDTSLWYSTSQLRRQTGGSSLISAWSLQLWAIVATSSTKHPDLPADQLEVQFHCDQWRHIKPDHFLKLLVVTPNEWNFELISIFQFHTLKQGSRSMICWSRSSLRFIHRGGCVWHKSLFQQVSSSHFYVCCKTILTMLQDQLKNKWGLNNCSNYLLPFLLILCTKLRRPVLE